jgi:ABC-2 type transport system ATP-binding protein
MAIISEGRVLTTGEPLAAVRELSGKIWRRAIAKGELEDYQRNHAVISTKLVSGKTVVHVLSEHRPDPSFEPVASSLEDVYFSTLYNATTEAKAA